MSTLSSSTQFIRQAQAASVRPVSPVTGNNPFSLPSRLTSPVPLTWDAKLRIQLNRLLTMDWTSGALAFSTVLVACLLTTFYAQSALLDHATPASQQALVYQPTVAVSETLAEKVVTPTVGSLQAKADKAVKLAVAAQQDDAAVALVSHAGHSHHIAERAIAPAFGSPVWTPPLLEKTHPESTPKPKTTIQKKPVRHAGLHFQRPASGHISSHFGHRWGRRHDGIDFGARYGSRIVASEQGTVTFAGWQSGYGRIVIIKHSNGYETRYAHCSKLTVRKGQWVNQGQLIARVGNSGHSTGPHLHFEIRRNKVAKNPLPFLRKPRYIASTAQPTIG